MNLVGNFVKARKRLGTLRGLIRTKRVLDENTVKFQTTKSLQCMQTMARVQAQMHSRRVRMAEENQALQRHLQQKREKELEKGKTAEDWDSSLLSKERIEENLLNKQEAAIKRERTLAYAYTHQWRNSTTDPSNSQWGWSWLERWMATRPRDHQSTEKINDHASTRSAGRSSTIPATTKQSDASFESTPTATQKSGRPLIHPSPAAPRSSPPSAAIRKKSESLGRASLNKGSLSSSERRLSLPSASKGRTSGTNVRRHSGPPMVDETTSSEEQGANPLSACSQLDLPPFLSLDCAAVVRHVF